jgi:glycine/D-amino acid oxidase-like deaminating enzyme
VPLLAGSAAAREALLTPGDGTLDPLRVIAWARRSALAAGARLEPGAGIVAVRGGAPLRVETTRGEWAAERVVIAAGAWAAALGERAGAAALPLVPHRRHLFLLAHALDPAAPYVWDLDRELYFRPHPEGALACMGDEEPMAELDARVAADAEARLRRAFAAWAPALAAAPLVRAWACFRTRAPDARPVIGPDPRRDDVWWLAGLAGHGLGSGPEVGRIAAEAMLHGAERLPPAVLPERLLARAGGGGEGSR